MGGGSATDPPAPRTFPSPAKLLPITAPTQSFFSLKESGGSRIPAPSGCWGPKGPLRPPPAQVLWPLPAPWLSSSAGLVFGARSSASSRREAATQEEALAPVSGRDMAPRTRSGPAPSECPRRRAVKGRHAAAAQVLARRRPAPAASHWRTPRPERGRTNGLPPFFLPAQPRAPTGVAAPAWVPGALCAGKRRGRREEPRFSDSDAAALSAVCVVFESIMRKCLF